MHHPELLNEYQSYLLDDRLMESDDSDTEREQKQEIEIIFSSTKQTKEEREKAMILLKKSNQNKIHESIHHRVSRQITVLANRNQNTKTQSLSYYDSYVFAPEGFFKIFWDLQCMILIIYEIISIPFLISFDIKISDALDIYIDIAFLVDIFLNFNTAFY